VYMDDIINIFHFRYSIKQIDSMLLTASGQQLITEDIKMW